MTWVLTAFLLSASIFTPILGRVGDMVGKERMLVVTLAALAAGSVVAGLAHSITVLIIARAIQGIGGAVLPLSFGIVRDEFPGMKVAGAVGIIAAMAAVGGGAGIVLAGPIVSNLNFHWLFWIPMMHRRHRHVCRPGSSCPNHRCGRLAGSVGWPPRCCPPGWSPSCWG